MKRIVSIALTAGLVLVLFPVRALAHCDALDGPVVRAARAALATRDVTPVLRWVSSDREAEVKAAFVRTLEVRGLGASAETLADTWFFETVVRIHRAGEGAPFDGLKPAGHIEPILAMADGTLDTGTIDQLLARVTAHIGTGVSERFLKARDLKVHANGLQQAASGAGGAHDGGGGR